MRCPCCTLFLISSFASQCGESLHRAICAARRLSEQSVLQESFQRAIPQAGRIPKICHGKGDSRCRSTWAQASSFRVSCWASKTFVLPAMHSLCCEFILFLFNFGRACLPSPSVRTGDICRVDQSTLPVFASCCQGDAFCVGYLMHAFLLAP